MKKTALILSCMLVITSCLRLDKNLYDADNKIEAYTFDAFGQGGLPELYGNAGYAIHPDNIHLFTLTSDDGGSSATIYAEYIGSIDSIAKDTVILYCHGNRWHMDNYWNRTKLLANAGGKHRYGVMTFDYRGFGKSSGSSTEGSMYADADACVRWLQSKGLTSDRLIIYGFSLGTAAAAELTANVRTLRPSKLILEAPFASSETMVGDGSGLSVPASFFTNVRIDNAEKIARVSQPFMWLHGTADDFLKISTHGEAVFANYKGAQGTAHRITHAGHSDVPRLMGYPRYLDELHRFISAP